MNKPLICCMIVAAAIASGCDSKSSVPPDIDTPPPSVAAVKPTSAQSPKASAPKPTPKPPAVDADIVPASKTYLKGIAEGLNHGAKFAGGGYMVKAKSYHNVYFVSAKITGPGIKPTWAMWALGGTGSNGDPSSIFSANEVAAQFSDWGRGDTTEAGAWFTDPDGTRLDEYVKDR